MEMKKIEGNLLEKLLQSKKHLVRQKFLAFFLCICLSVVSLPIDFFGFQVLAEGIQRQIMYFLPLSEGIRQQTVDVGTELEDLELPNTLTVMSAFSISENAEFSGEKEEITEIENVAWDCESVYDSRTEGIYTFLPVLPEHCSMAEHIEVPRIEITVMNLNTFEPERQDQGEVQPEDEKEEFFLENGEKEEIFSEDEIEEKESISQDGNEEKKSISQDGNEEKESISEEGNEEKENISEDENEEKESISQDGRKERESISQDGMKKKKFLGDEVDGKRFSKEEVIEDEIIMLEEKEEDIETEPKVIEVTQDSAWEDIWQEDSENVTIIVKEGVALTINDRVIINKNVTIEGSGKIVRENGNACFQVGMENYPSESSWRPKLVIHGITLDGNKIFSSNSLIYVRNGSLELDNGCAIQNVDSGKSEGNSVSAVYVSSGSTGVIGNITIKDCSAELSGGAIINFGQLTINGGTYINNSSKSSGGCIYNAGKLTINGGNFSGNHAAKSGGVITNFSNNSEYNGNIVINGGTFQGNKASLNGGCINSSANTNLEIHGGSFIENEAMYGGGINASGALTVDGGLFEKNCNVPEKEGGAISYGGFDADNFSLSGEVVFSGSENGSDFYTDSVCFTQLDQMYSRGPVLHPVNIYLAFDTSNPVIVGKEGYEIQKSDLKNIHIFDVENPEKKWYNRLEKETNQIFVTDVEPEEEEEEEKTFTAYFYSGSAGQRKTETVNTLESAASAELTAPDLEEMIGWTAMGWRTDLEGFEQTAAPGLTLTLNQPETKFYGIYQKEVTISYDANNESNKLEKETKLSYANVHDEITYKIPEFTMASIENQGGGFFAGWNTKADGTGENFQAGSVQKLDHDITLYAVWKENPDAAVYQVEYYLQDVEGDGYTKADAGTETFMEAEETEVEAKIKEFQGFTLNGSHPLGVPKGTVKKDGSLVLKLYYDRNVYQVDFNLNGGYGEAPDTQKVRYGGKLQPVENPMRAGYNFKGWHLDEEKTDGGLWDFEEPVENNIGSLHTTLYARWQDELAPVMGEASYRTGHKNFLNWALQKKSLVITVPVIEEGSGLSKAEYLLAAADETEKDGLAEIIEKHSLSDDMMNLGSGASVIRALQDKAEQGAYEVRIPIEEEFKGKVYLTCTDLEGNVSAQKILTAAGGGIIIEDNAPEISFSNTEEKTAKPVNVKVLVEDGKDGTISGGISEITYQVDKGKRVTVPKENFNQKIVESYDFTVKVSGEGRHTLWVGAEDYVGNASEAKVTLKISGKKEAPVEAPDEPQIPGNPGTSKDAGGSGNTGGSGFSGGPEPRTGDSLSESYVKVCATAAMIAGFGYLLLYFKEENGITEQKKEEIVYRLVEWAKKGGKLRRIFGLAVIFLFLAYYYSIGKSETVEWREICTERAGKNFGS